MTSLSAWAEKILEFWFVDLERADWFKNDPALDAKIRFEFLATVERLATEMPGEAYDDPRAALAAILALDQFPRNLFRGTPRAFENDAQALKLAANAVERGFDSKLPDRQRVFVYLPFEHSEDAADQARSVKLTEALGDAEFTRFAIAHKEIIARFGRFPHRNVILGRTSTPEEIAFLAEPGSSF